MSLISCPECKQQISSTAPTCPSCGYVLQPQPLEPQFEAYRRRLLTGCLIVCIIGLPIGMVLRLPLVCALGILGIIVAAIKLAGMRSSTRT